MSRGDTLAVVNSGRGKPSLRLGRRKWLLLVSLVSMVAACGGRAAEPLDASVFEHSGGAALEVTEGPEVSFAPFPDADMRVIEYSNPDGDRVTGILAHPPDGPGEAGVIILPGLPESASQNLEPLALLSCAGATALALDAPYVRDGRMANPLLFDETDREEQIQFVIEAKRAVDVLEGAGATRFGVSAFSWGVSIGAMLAGVEDRIDAYALTIGNSGLVERFIHDGDPVGPLVGVAAEQREQWVEEMEPLDAKLYVGNSTANILFQSGRNDPFVTPESAERLHAAAPATTEVIWYDVGHDVTPEMIADHFGWLGDQLGLDPGRVSDCVTQMPSS